MPETPHTHVDDPDGPPLGIPLTKPDELLWRQVAIAFQDQGVPTYQAFCPTKKDRKRLSTRRSEVMTAETAYSEHRAANGSTAGTWGVTVAEAEGSGTPAYDDSSLPGVPRGHASLYFGGKSRWSRRPSCS
jgi:hypothetical protein